MASRETMRPVDRAWLRMDRPTGEMVITSALMFREAIPFADIDTLVRTRLLRIERFRQRVRTPRIGSPRWERDPYFTLSAHLMRHVVAAPGGEAEMFAAIDDIASQPLDHDHPLWEVHVLEGLREGTALVVRLHHCIGDGVALVSMLLGLTDEGRTLVPPEVGVAWEPAHGLDLIKRGAAHAATLARLVTLPADPPSGLRGALGTRKRFAATRSHPLSEIKRIAHALGASFNDVLVAAVAGALRARLIRESGATAPVRAMLPMFIRRPGAGASLGNYFGLVYVPMPLEIADPVARVIEVHRRMRQVKSQPDASVAFEVLGALGFAPRPVEELAIDMFTAKASVMITDVAGPPVPLHLEGHGIADFLVWAPVSGSLALSISILSYAGRVRVTVGADEHVIPDPQSLADAIGEELRILEERS